MFEIHPIVELLDTITCIGHCGQVLHEFHIVSLMACRGLLLSSTKVHCAKLRLCWSCYNIYRVTGIVVNSYRDLPLLNLEGHCPPTWTVFCRVSALLNPTKFPVKPEGGLVSSDQVLLLRGYSIVYYHSGQLVIIPDSEIAKIKPLLLYKFMGFYSFFLFQLCWRAHIIHRIFERTSIWPMKIYGIL